VTALIADVARIPRTTQAPDRCSPFAITAGPNRGLPCRSRIGFRMAGWAKSSRQIARLAMAAMSDSPERQL